MTREKCMRCCSCYNCRAIKSREHGARVNGTYTSLFQKENTLVGIQASGLLVN